MALFVISLLSFSMVSASFVEGTDLKVVSVEINEVNFVDAPAAGTTGTPASVLAVEEGQTLKIRVGLEAVAIAGDLNPGVEDIEVEAKISGYEYSDFDNLEDSTHLFDIAAGTTKFVNLEITLPKELDDERYWLRLRVLDQNSEAIAIDIELAIEPARHGVDIADVAFSPGSTVKAGRSLYADVLLQNFGAKEEKDVKVTVAVPALGVSATEYVDVAVAVDDTVDVDEMVLRIPETAEEGDYEVEVTLAYDGLETVVKETYTLHVLADKAFQDQENVLVLAVGPETQNVAAGKTATYAVALTNAGAVSKAFSLETAVGDWATATLSESLVVLEPGKNQIVYVDVTVAKDTVAGEHLASLTVKSGSDVLQTVVLKANVVGSSAAQNDGISLRSGLEIALVVLVVLLIILGLVIGFSRLRKDDDGEEQTYY